MSVKIFSVSATKGDEMWRLLKQAGACGITVSAMLRWTLRAVAELALHKGDELDEKTFGRMAEVISHTSIVRLDYIASAEDVYNALCAVDETLAELFRGTSMSTLLRASLMARARAVKAGEAVRD